jgi:hypothetical protein
MKKLLLTVLLVGTGFAVAQTTNVYIYDSSGNSTTGTISNGNVFFNDSNGNTTFGTIRDGQVFLNSSSGNTTFGTVRDGNVFLNDKDGVTTGTIRNGNIFLNNSDGSTTIGNYYNGSIYTTTGGNTTATPSPAARQSDSSYQAGYAMGSALGAGIGRLVLNHRLHSFCKKHPGETWHYRVQGAVRGEGTCPGSAYAVAPSSAVAPVRQTTAAIPAPALQPAPQPSVIGSVASQPASAGTVYDTTITQPGDRQEDSLGDVARRYRAQKVRQESTEQKNEDQR